MTGSLQGQGTIPQSEIQQDLVKPRSEITHTVSEDQLSRTDALTTTDRVTPKQTESISATDVINVNEGPLKSADIISTGLGQEFDQNKVLLTFNEPITGTRQVQVLKAEKIGDILPANPHPLTFKIGNTFFQPKHDSQGNPENAVKDSLQTDDNNSILIDNLDPGEYIFVVAEPEPVMTAFGPALNQDGKTIKIKRNEDGTPRMKILDSGFFKEKYQPNPNPDNNNSDSPNNSNNNEGEDLGPPPPAPIKPPSAQLQLDPNSSNSSIFVAQIAESRFNHLTQPESRYEQGKRKSPIPQRNPTRGINRIIT